MYVQSSGEGLSNGFLSGSPRTKFAALNTRERKKETHYKACWQLSNWIRFFCEISRPSKHLFFAADLLLGTRYFSLLHTHINLFSPAIDRLVKREIEEKNAKEKRELVWQCRPGKKSDWAIFLSFQVVITRSWRRRRRSFFLLAWRKYLLGRRQKGKEKRKEGERRSDRSWLLHGFSVYPWRMHACVMDTRA